MKFLELFMRDRPRALQALDDPSFKKKWVNQASAYGWTCAHQVALDGDFIALSKLIDNGINFWTLNKDDKYPLHYAVIESHYEIVKMILSYEIPKSVIKWYPKYHDFSDTSCWFRVAISLEDLRIERLLVDALFHLINDDSDIPTDFVHYALLQKNAYDIIINVFSENVVAMDILRAARSLDVHIESGNACPKVVDFLLHIPGRITPITMNNKFLKKPKSFANINAYRILESFLRYPDKVNGINNAENFLLAIINGHYKVIDLLLAVGCDPHALIPGYESNCFIETLKTTFCSYDLKDNLHIVHKILMWGGIKDYENYMYFINIPAQQTVTGKLNHFTKLYKRTIVNYCKHITLFDILHYRQHIEDLREKIIQRL